MSAPRILISNDDGYVSDGLRALVDAVSPLGEVWVVAPEAEQSASSHAISIHRPLRIREVRERWYAIDGTPTDCSYIAINHLMKDARPQLMVSGINHGPNLAGDVTYSGTGAAAIAGAILGVPAIAFSLVSRGGPMDFAPAARFAHRLAEAALAQELPPSLLLNVNVPGGVEPNSYAVTRLGKHSYGFEVIEKVDPRGRKYYWIGGNEYQHDDIPGSDCNAVLRDGVVSVTPLHLALTANEMSPLVEKWPVRGFTRVPPVSPR